MINHIDLKKNKQNLLPKKYTEAGSYILINSKLRQGVDHLFSLGVLWTIAQQVIN